MVKAISRLEGQGCFEIQPFFDLKNTLREVGHMRVEFVLCDNAATPQADQFAFFDRLTGKYTAPTFFFEFARVTFRV